MTQTSNTRRKLTELSRLPTNNRYGIPFVRKQLINLTDVDLISFTDICPETKTETLINRVKGVHFFIDDDRFHAVVEGPGKYVDKLSPYRFVLTPDVSQYADLPLCWQITAVERNRMCGAMWQQNGLVVIPTVSWGSRDSYSVSFLGIEKGSIVAVATYGCRKREKAFLEGYKAMLEAIEPCAVICYGAPFDGMEGTIFEVDPMASRKVDRNGR